MAADRGTDAEAPAFVAGWTSVRVRILATVLALTGLAMALAGGTLILVQRSRAYERADDVLTRDVAEFRALAATGLDPGGRVPFTDVTALLRASVQRQVPAQEETFLALIDGKPSLVPAGARPVALEDEPELVDSVAGLTPDAPVRIRQVETAAGPVRYAAVQAHLPGRTEVGTYVVAFVMTPSLSLVSDSARLYALVAFGSLLVVGLVGWVVAGRLLRPLRLLRAAAENISHTDLSSRIPVTGNDDVSDLTRTFNQMLDRLQSAFEAQQRFLDDAGHELRTPVTIVRGHLEVLDVDDAAEVAETRVLALDELDRMGRLVGDLMVLAKARRPDFVSPAPVDVDRLTDDVADKATALGDRRWQVDERAERTVLADAQRLTQALLQLASNAVRHTQPGDVIGLGSAVVAGELRMWVRDVGPGVRPADQERIFERFGRGEPSAGTARGDDGSGLGLAIVSAIALAHGGRVDLDSVQGHGATFTVVLPGTLLLPDPTGPAGSRVPVPGGSAGEAR